MKTNHFLLVAGVSLALAFTFSCSSDDGGGSTTGGGDSSSNSVSQKFCVYSSTQECFATNMDSCPAGGELSDICPFPGQGGSSSSGGGSGGSSSSGGGGGGSSSSLDGEEEEFIGYCDYGPPHTGNLTPACVPVTSASDCNTGGIVVEECGYRNESMCDYGDANQYGNGGCYRNEGSCTGGSIVSHCPGTGAYPYTFNCVGSDCRTIMFCGDKAYKPDLKFCSGTTILDYCGGATYDPATQLCSGTTILGKCGDKAYDSKKQYCSNGVLKDKGTLLDTRDNKTYAYVVIGTQTWMAENLNYNASGSKCYNDLPANCATYGRLYDWATAMNIASTYNESNYPVSGKHQGVCPNNWHIPSDDEWTTLTNYVESQGGCTDCAGTRLKAMVGWNNGNGTDNHGFSALPGSGNYRGYGYSVGSGGSWWTSSGSSNAYANDWVMDGGKSAYWDSNYKTSLFSVRCLMDY